MQSHNSKFLSTVFLEELALGRRTPPRAVEFREEDYLAKFDSLVFCYDAIRLETRALLLCPPFYEIKQKLLEIEFRALPGGEELIPRINTFNRLSRVWFDLPDSAIAIEAVGVFGSKIIHLNPALTEIFAGMRVGVTISKDNDPLWVRDWAYYHHKTAGMNAVILYDNNTTKYSSDVLVEALKSSGISILALVAWPYKWGPIGIMMGHRREHWDSNYGQLGMLEHARWKYLTSSASVLNCDIDELVAPKRSGDSVFDAVEGNPMGYLSMPGVWIEATRSDAASQTTPRHAHFFKSSVPASETLTKWACVPAAIPEGIQWGVHQMRNSRGHPFRKHISESFGYYHFRGLTTAWKPERSAAEQALLADRVAKFEARPDLIDSFARAGWTIE